MRKFLVVVGFILIILIFSYLGMMMGMMAGANTPKDQNPFIAKQKTAIEKTKVNIKEAELKAVPLIISGEGRVNSAQTIQVTSEVQGKIIGGNRLKMGSSFSKGQLLYSIDDNEYRLSIKSRKSSFITMFAAILTDLKVDYPDRFSTWSNFYQNIDPEKSLPELPSFASSKEKTFIASKGILGEYYNIKSMEERLRKYNYYAPFSGSVVQSFAERGTIVNPGSPVVNIIQNGQLEVEIPLTIEASKTIDIGMKVSLKDRTSGQEFVGKVTRKGGFVNANTQSIPVYVQVLGSNKLYNGMYLFASFNVGEVSDVVSFPRHAMVDDQHVFIVRDSLLFTQKVGVVYEDNNQVYLKGITEGTKVVIDPVANGKDSLLVEPVINPLKD